MPSRPAEPPRPRNAAATRAAILDSAIRHFAAAGYDGVGVREIARDAGVTAMMVNRYFGSKEQLFAEAVETSFAPAVFIAEQPQDIARDAAAMLVERTAPGVDAPEPFLIMLRSVSNPRAAQIVRDAIERHVGARLAGQLSGSGRRTRADLALSVISGVILMRSVIGARSLRKGTDELVDLIERVFAAIVDAPGG